jgi:hypothetical protein
MTVNHKTYRPIELWRYIAVQRFDDHRSAGRRRCPACRSLPARRIVEGFATSCAARQEYHVREARRTVDFDLRLAGS